MKKSFKAIQLGIVFMIALASVFAIVNVSSEESSTASAQIIPQLPVVLDISRGDQNRSMSVDPANPGQATIIVSYSLESPIELIERFYIPPTTVTLDVQGDEEDWITVTLDKNELEMFNDGKDKTVTLSLAVTEEAPYTQQRKITVVATAEGKTLWKTDTKTLDITYTPSFLYFVSAESKASYFETSPQEPISIPISVKNSATYGVKFDFSMDQGPDGWTITAPNSIEVSPSQKGENVQETLISVTPPYDFGYHDEVASFTVKVYAKPFPIGEDYVLIDTLNFEVQSRGFSLSPSGYGIIVMILPIIIILLLIFVVLYNKNKKK